MLRKVLASLFGGMVVFAWGTISWTILPWHLSSMGDLPDGGKTIATLSDIKATSGVYIYPPTPDTGDENALKEWQEKYAGGPYISMLVYHQGGYTESMAGLFLRGYALNVAGAGFIVFLFGLTGMQEKSYRRRVGFVALLGIFASVVGPLTEWNWWGFSASFSVPVVLDGIIAWSLAGSVIAAFLKPTA